MFELHQPLARAGNDPRCRSRRSNPALCPCQPQCARTGCDSSYGLSIVGYGLIRVDGETTRHSCSGTRDACRADNCLTSACRAGNESSPTNLRHCISEGSSTKVDCIHIVYSGLGTRFKQRVFGSECRSRRAKSDQPTNPQFYRPNHLHTPAFCNSDRLHRRTNT